MENFAESHARKGDPETSKAAAVVAKNFYSSHCGRIYTALVQHGPMTVDEIAELLEMQSQQVNKRLPDLQRLGLATPQAGAARLSAAGLACRAWVATPGGAIAK